MVAKPQEQLFYQKFWYLVKGEVCKEVLTFVNMGVLDQSMNTTHIALVPKIKEPQYVTEYRL